MLYSRVNDARCGGEKRNECGFPSVGAQSAANMRLVLAMNLVWWLVVASPYTHSALIHKPAHTITTQNKHDRDDHQFTLMPKRTRHNVRWMECLAVRRRNGRRSITGVQDVVRIVLAPNDLSLFGELVGSRENWRCWSGKWVLAQAAEVTRGLSMNFLTAVPGWHKHTPTHQMEWSITIEKYTRFCRYTTLPPGSRTIRSTRSGLRTSHQVKVSLSPNGFHSRCEQYVLSVHDYIALSIHIYVCYEIVLSSKPKIEIASP